MATKSISQLTARTQANTSDLFEVAYADEQSSTGYASGKMSAEVIANGIVNKYTYTSAMPNMGSRTLAGAMNTMLEGFAPAYDDTQTYAVGDYCTYAGKMYKCTTAVTTAGAWDSAKWTEATCAEEFGTDVEVDSALSTTSENPVQNKVITQNINSINANLVSEKTTAKADIVSISDAQDIPAEGVKADIEPIQDLHGYDYPWVGGAGKNIFDEIYTNISDTLIYRAIAVPNGTYIMSTSVPYNENGATLFLLAGNVSSGASSSVNGVDMYTSRTVTATDGYVTVAYRTVNNGAINPANYQTQIEAGSTATTYEPYSNICPISGYTECEVTGTGVNQWDEEWELGAIGTDGQLIDSTTTIRCKNYIKVTPSTTFYFKSPSIAYIHAYDDSYNWISIIYNGGYNSTFTTPANCEYIKFRLTGDYGTTYNNDISINYPSTITTYQPYQGQTYTVSFNDTVYSGTLDVTTGILTVDKAMVEYDGSNDETWTSTGTRSVLLGNGVTNRYGLGSTIKLYGISNIVPNQTNAELSQNYIQAADVSSTTLQCFATEFGLSSNDITEWRTFLTNNPLQICYELATPQTYNLTPTQIDMLLNNNVLSASTGKIQVKYQPANVVGELKKLIYQLTNQ